MLYHHNKTCYCDNHLVMCALYRAQNFCWKTFWQKITGRLVALHSEWIKIINWRIELWQIGCKPPILLPKFYTIWWWVYQEIASPSHVSIMQSDGVLWVLPYSTKLHWIWRFMINLRKEALVHSLGLSCEIHKVLPIQTYPLWSISKHHLLTSCLYVYICMLQFVYVHVTCIAHA